VTFRLLFVFVVLGHDRRRAIHFNVTAHPTAEWTARQIAEAFPWDGAPRYLLHDRDSIYGGTFRRRVEEMGIREVLTAPRSPWQNRLRGALHRVPAKRVPGPHRGDERSFLAPHCQIVFTILRALTVTFGAGERRARIQSHSTWQRVSWWSCRRWVGCIIATSEELPESTHHSGQLSSLHLHSLKCRAPLIATMVSGCLRH
jgi:hypothetical protein